MVSGRRSCPDMMPVAFPFHIVGSMALHWRELWSVVPIQERLQAAAR